MMRKLTIAVTVLMMSVVWITYGDIIPPQGGGGGATTLKNLTDVDSYTNHSGEYMRVKEDESGVEWGVPPNTMYQADGTSLTLSDTTFSIAPGGVTATMLAEGAVDETSLTDSVKDCGVDICYGGDSTVIESSIVRDIVVPYNCSILSCSIYSDSGSVQFDIWKDTSANFPPTNDDSIVASANPAITAGTKYTDSTLTGWKKDLNKGDILRVVIDSVATMTRATLHLQLRRR